MIKMKGWDSRLGYLIGLLIFGWPCLLHAQTLEITNDKGVTLSGTQVVNVGEHIQAKARVLPAGTSSTNLQWSVTGTHIKDWVTKDSEIQPMQASDYTGETIHFIWKDITPPGSTNVLSVSVLVGATTLTASIEFQVERNPKAEKFYSDDLLMENHNNWHSVYMFSAASTRRGDVFLGWHRSQLEYFNNWRTYFGYPPISNWDPTTAWVTGSVPPEKQHPSTGTPPASGFSSRHGLITLDLADQGLETTEEGEYDLVTQALGRGTNSEFVSDGYVVKLETVRDIIGQSGSSFSLTGTPALPTWWRPQMGQTANDPWYEAGCPARATPTSTVATPTCSVAEKKSFDDYTLRELGESVESGRYANTFRVNYHALGHIAASGDMANPATSMRDPIFWAWHTHLDMILSSWQSTKGAEAVGPLSIYSKPTFNAGWSSIKVAFSNRVIPEFVRPENVTVNGSPATSVTDVSLTGTGYIFEFSGFSVPSSGAVEVIVRREINNNIRTIASDPRPTPTLIMSTFGNVLSPAVNKIEYTKP